MPGIQTDFNAVFKQHLDRQVNLRVEIQLQSWLVWLSGLSIDLQTKKLLVRVPVRAHAWVAGHVPSWGPMRGNWSTFPLHISVSPTLSPTLLSKNK